MSNSTFKKICITLIALIVIVVAATIVVNVMIDKKVDQQVSAFDADLKNALTGDEYVYRVIAGEMTAMIQANDSFLELTNKAKLEKAQEYIAIATKERSKYDRINGTGYVCVHIVSMSGIDIIKSDTKGLIEIVLGK